MSRWAMPLAISMALVGSVACADSHELSESDRAAIRHAGAAYAAAVNAGDVEGRLALHTEDAILLPPDHASVQGKVAIRAFFESGLPVADFQVQILEIDGRDDLAYTREVVTFTHHPPGVAPIQRRIKVMAVWRRSADGSWKIFRDAWNADAGTDSEQR